MRMILSPAKKMRRDDDFSLPVTQPQFMVQTEKLYQTMQTMTYEELKKVWKCSDKLAEENMERLREMDLYHRLTPALLAYEGIAYQYMAPSVFSDQQLDYVREHLRILSGFYGVLRPTDGVTPYRLEMCAKLKTEGSQDLYQFWGSRLADLLRQETDCIVNLASKEYSKAVLPYLPAEVRAITCVFAQRKAGKLVEQSTACKMARGDMVRFLAEQQIENPEDMKQYERLNYRFSPEESDEASYVFIKEEA